MPLGCQGRRPAGRSARCKRRQAQPTTPRGCGQGTLPHQPPAAICPTASVLCADLQNKQAAGSTIKSRTWPRQPLQQPVLQQHLYQALWVATQQDVGAAPRQRSRNGDLSRHGAEPRQREWHCAPSAARCWPPQMCTGHRCSSLPWPQKCASHPLVLLSLPLTEPGSPACAMMVASRRTVSGRALSSSTCGWCTSFLLLNQQQMAVCSRWARCTLTPTGLQFSCPQKHWLKRKLFLLKRKFE